MIDINDLTHDTLVIFALEYDNYVREVIDDPERGEPVTMSEYLNNDFIENLEDEGYGLSLTSKNKHEIMVRL
jgi:hypothetical protein